jgi:hypothetical protein
MVRVPGNHRATLIVRTERHISGGDGPAIAGMAKHGIAEQKRPALPGREVIGQLEVIQVIHGYLRSRIAPGNPGCQCGQQSEKQNENLECLHLEPKQEQRACHFFFGSEGGFDELSLNLHVKNTPWPCFRRVYGSSFFLNLNHFDGMIWREAFLMRFLIGWLLLVPGLALASIGGVKPFETAYGPYHLKISPVPGYGFYRSTVYLKNRILISDQQKKALAGMIQNQWLPSSVKDEDVCETIGRSFFVKSKIAWKKSRTGNLIVCDPAGSKVVGSSVFLVPTRLPVKGMKIRSVLRVQWNETTSKREVATRIMEKMKYE